MGKIGLIFVVLLSISIVSAGYKIELNQKGNTLLVNETLNGSSVSQIDSDAIETSGKNFFVLKKIEFPDNFDNAEIILNLEKGVIIRNNEIFPAGYEIKTDGERISISWKVINVKKEEPIAIFVGLEDTKGGISYLLIGLIIIALVILVGFLIIRKKPRLKSNNYDYLLDTEKRVIEELKKADRNELWQRRLQDSTGFSKAKVSRVVRNLESRGLVKKIPFGNTNKIRLN